MVESKVRHFLKTDSGLKPGDRLLVAVSGGPDSVAMLHALWNLRGEHHLSLCVAHFHHGLRGDEADDDARFCTELADSLGLLIKVGRGDVMAHRLQRRCSLEQAARELRYAFFAEAASELGADGVAVGHTADDQVETVLMHLLRGTGLRGLQGMLPRQQLQVKAVQSFPEGRSLLVLRPLLNVSRDEIIAYCKDSGLVYRIDSSNIDLRFTRNRIRWELLPTLERHNPNLKETILRAAQTAAADYAFIESQVDAIWSQVAATREEGIVYDLNKLASLPRALQSQLIREGFRHLTGDLVDLEAKHIDAVLMLASSIRGSSARHLAGGIRAIREYSRLTLSPETSSKSEGPLPTIGINIPGTTVMAGWKKIVRAEIKGRPCSWSPDKIGGGHHADMDFNSIGSDLWVRTRQAGDRLRPLGMDGTKKVHDILVDAKISRWERDKVPLLVDGHGRVLWLVGYRLSDLAKVEENTTKVLCLTVGPAE